MTDIITDDSEARLDIENWRYIDENADAVEASGSANGGISNGDAS